MPYAAVLFDLFDTLVHFERERFPAIQVNGRTVYSTAGCLHEVLRSHAPHVSLEACYEALVASWQEAERLRALDHREVRATERFADLFRRLALEADRLPAGLAERLIETHRRELSKAARFPAHHRRLLERLARRYRLAVVSNFDYTPTAEGILDAAGVKTLFTAIVVSDAIGWRTPRAAIFERALQALDVRAAEALFVGDRADIDVLGAHQVGMDAAWVNPGGDALPPGVAPPEFEIRDLEELGAILDV
jgi:HAD superfamily hydrolase (TIGR01549 family)